jgi:hypothetical protein
MKIMFGVVILWSPNATAVRPALAGTFTRRLFGTPVVIRASPINYAVGFDAGGQLRRGLQLLDADRAGICEGFVDPHPRHRAGSLPHPTPADQKSLSAPERLPSCASCSE